jgi:hypothetical protein
MKHLCMVAALAIPLFAQSNATDASVSGYVSDAQKATLPNASVTLRNKATNQQLETTTNEGGYYRFPLVRIGEYELTVKAPSMADYRQDGIRLSVGQQARIDVSLAVSSVSETVTVTADASIVESGAATGQGEVLGERAVRELPITSRNVYNFHLLGPGVKGLPSSGFGTTQFLFGGHNRSTWTVDGLDNTQRRFNRQIRLVISTPESVEEMQVLSGGYSAEFGRASGGVINVISRSGSNDLHGSGMWLYRPNDLTARPPLAATRPQQTWWMVSGNLSGALIKNRLFYFINNEYNPLTRPEPVTINADAARAIGLSQQDLANSPFGETFHTPSAKLNFQLNAKNSGFVRYNRFTNDQPGAGGGLTAISRSLSFEDRMNGGAAQLATVISPSVLNELRFGINRRSEIRDTYVEGDPNGFHVNITGVANFGVNPLAANESIETSSQIIDNVSWTRGRHTFKFGADYQITDFKLRAALGRTYTFGGLTANTARPAVSPLNQYLFTTQRLIDPSTNRPYSYTTLSQDLGQRDIGLRFNYLNFFAQDEWRVAPSLTLTLGVRYEATLFPTLDEQAPNPLSRKINNDLNNFAPRFGFSWAPGNRKTVVRGGYGLFYDSTGLDLVVNAAQQNGRRVLAYTIPGTDATAPPFGQILSSAPSAFQIAPDINVFPENFQIMYGHNANLQIEREVFKDLAVNVQYSYWGHRFAPYARDTNLSAPASFLADGRPVFRGSAGRPDTRFRRVLLIDSGSTSNYNALDLTIRKRFQSGLQFSTTWSWSHALSDSNMQGGAVTDPTNRRLDYGNSNGDVRHNVAFQGLYAPELKTPALRWMNGLQFSTVTFYNSGFPVNVVAGPDLNNDLTTNDRLPGRGRNSVFGPDYFQVDFRLARNITFRERYQVQLIAESENLLNRLNANCSIEGCTGAVVNRDGAADLLRITSARAGRYLQFGFRFKF